MTSPNPVGAVTRFTPGPWPLETVITNGGRGICHKVGIFPTKSQIHPTSAACIYADGLHQGDEQRDVVAAELFANAHLIAAAPDLYRALNAIMEDMERGVSIQGPRTRARKALAKARGETP